MGHDHIIHVGFGTSIKDASAARPAPLFLFPKLRPVSLSSHLVMRQTLPPNWGINEQLGSSDVRLFGSNPRG